MPYYCNPKCQKSHKRIHEKVCPLWAPWKDLAGGVEIKPSTLPGAGRGLFAVKDFRPGEALAVYSGKKFSSAEVASLTYGVTYGANPYAQTISAEEGGIIGERDPALPHLGAQIANDPFFRAGDLFLSLNCENPDLAAIQQMSMEYLRLMSSSPRPTRMTLRGGHVQLVALQAIPAGQEIFYAYGLDYWIGRMVALCDRKGYFFQGKSIQRAASMAVEIFLGGSGTLRSVEALSEMFSLYISSKDFDIFREEFPTYPDLPVDLKLASILTSLSRMRFLVVDKEAFMVMSIELHLDERLKAIARAENREFFSEDGSIVSHPLSRALFRDIMDYMRTHTPLPALFANIVAVEERSLTPEESQVLGRE